MDRRTEPLPSPQQKRFLSRFWKSYLVFTGVFIVFYLAAIVIVDGLVAREVDRFIQEEINHALTHVSMQIDPQMLLALAETGEPNAAGFSDDPRYLELLAVLDRVHQVQPDAWPYLFVEAEEPGYVYFVVDLMAIYLPEMTTLFMEPYKGLTGYPYRGLEGQTFRHVDRPLVAWLRRTAGEIRMQQVSVALTGLADWLVEANIAPPLEFGIYGDKYGRWATGYIPLETLPGQPRAGAGVDYIADVVEEERDSARSTLNLAFLVAFPLCLVFLYFVIGAFTGPALSLTRSARQIEEGKPDVRFSMQRIGFFRDELDDLADMLNRMVAALRHRDEQYHKVVSTLSEYIARWQPDGKITFVNQAMADFMGESVEYLLKTDTYIHQIFSKNEPEIYDQIFNLFLNTLSPDKPEATLETEHQSPDEVKTWVHWRLQAFFDQHGQVGEFQAVGRDLTELKRAQAELKAANQQLQQLSRQLISEREQDLSDLARELHDEVLGHLGDLMMGWQEANPDLSPREVYKLVIDQIRATIHAMRSPMLSYGLYLALEDFYDILVSQSIPGLSISFEIPQSDVRFDREVETQLYRIMQEACNNAIRHAHPAHLYVGGSITADGIDLFVEDDGQGFIYDGDLQATDLLEEHKYGLVGMQERAEIIGAKLHITSTPESGTHITLSWRPRE